MGGLGDALALMKDNVFVLKARNTQTLRSRLCTKGTLGCSCVLLVWAAEGVQFSIVLYASFAEGQGRVYVLVPMLLWP